MSVFRYRDQERREIARAQEQAIQQSRLNASIARRKAESTTSTGFQPLDDDLTAIAALTPANDDLLQRKAGAWVNRTIADVKADMALDAVNNTADADKPVSAAQQAEIDTKLDTWVSVPASASATGTAGQIAYDGSYFYVCVSSNVWVRASLATW